MHKSIQELKEVTEACFLKLDEMDYDEMQVFLLKREQLIARIQESHFTPAETESHRAAIADIVAKDQAIVSRMEAIKQGIGAKLANFKRAQTQKSMYEKQLAHYDGMYFDRKK